MYRFIMLFAFAMLLVMAACNNPIENDDDDDHAEAEGLVLELAGVTILTVQDAEVSDTLTVSAGETTDAYEVEFLDGDGDRIHAEDFDEDFSLDWQVRDESVLTVDADGRWSFTLTGRNVDTTALVLQLMHVGHPDFTTPDIPVVVQ